MGWEQLISIFQENRELIDEDRSKTPVACPNDGEPLQQGPDGELFCPSDGWRPTFSSQ